MDLEKVKDQLDEILLKFFDTLTRYYETELELESYISSGLLNMSRARYNVGVKAVSISQINESNMSASVKVDVTEPSVDSALPEDVFSLILVPPSTQIADDSDLKQSDEDKGLRKRKTKDQLEQPAVNEVEDVGAITNGSIKEDVKGNKGRSRGSADPLKWFGVLVPQTLRQSQADFKKAVLSVVYVANLKHQVIALSKEYKRLLKVKSDLLKSA